MRLLLILLMLLPAAPAFGKVDVVASIAPVHSLVARVMEGTGTPHLLLPPAASPHDYALRPSDAAALSGSTLVVRVGPALEPWLDGPLKALASGTQVLRLDNLPGVTRLKMRDTATFASGALGRDASGRDAQDPTEAQLDPHLWLDPQNARVWLAAIAEALARIDPQNADRYRANAEAAASEIGKLATILQARLKPVSGRPFVVLHDAFHYFERRFGIAAAGAISVGSARPPGPARLMTIRTMVTHAGVGCIFVEPQVNTRLARAVAAGTKARIVALDPIGVGLTPGPELYPQVLIGIADGLASCLGR